MSLAICSICKTSAIDAAMVLVPRNDEKRELWSKVCGISLQRSSLICGSHFAEKDFIGNGGGSAQRRRLKSGAIPSMLYMKNEFEEFLITHSGKESNDGEDLEDTEPYCKQENLEEFIKEEVFDENLSTGVDRRKQYRTRGVQTCEKSTITCGLIEVTTDNQMYSLNCFYCDEVFALWDWAIFIQHLKKQHNAKSTDIGRRPKTTQHKVQRSGSDSDRTEMKENIADDNCEFASNSSILQYNIEEDDVDMQSSGDKAAAGTVATAQEETQLVAKDDIPPSAPPSYLFNCSVCCKNFKFKCWLTRHMLIHSNEKPFICKYCGARFGRKDYLYKHSLRCRLR